MKLGGRPRIYKTADELEKAIDVYFDWVKEQNTRPAISRMALFLGFASRQSIHDYAKSGEFSYLIKRALTFIEAFHEETLDTGAIFWLKCHLWNDQSGRDESVEKKDSIKPILENGKELPE